MEADGLEVRGALAKHKARNGPGMPLHSPCRDFVTRWNGGACPPAWNGPWLPTRVLWVTKLGPGLVAHGLRASAWPQGAGTQVLWRRGVATSLEAGGQSPGRVLGVTPQGLPEPTPLRGLGFPGAA